VQQDGVGPDSANAHADRQVGTDREYLWDAPPNLRVLTGATATRIMMENGRATGVELIAGRDRPADQPSTPDLR
jgi:choline dehydrogenase